MLDVKCTDHFERVQEYAKEVGLEDDLKKQLDYLATYACSEDEPDRTKCSIYKDFAPYSFGFTMLSKVPVRSWACSQAQDGCGNVWEERVQSSKSTPNLSGEKTVYCPKCGRRASFGSPVDFQYTYWFNGGLIFFNIGESGGYPQLTCRLDTSTRGWSIHT